jgi:cytochrome P450
MLRRPRRLDVEAHEVDRERIPDPLGHRLAERPASIRWQELHPRAQRNRLQVRQRVLGLDAKGLAPATRLLEAGTLEPLPGCVFVGEVPVRCETLEPRCIARVVGDSVRGSEQNLDVPFATALGHQLTARAQRGEEAGEEPVVIEDPMKRRGREHGVDFPVEVEREEVDALHCDSVVVEVTTRFGDHRRVGVDGDDPTPWEAFEQRRGDAPAATPGVEHDLVSRQDEPIEDLGGEWLHDRRDLVVRAGIPRTFHVRRLRGDAAASVPCRVHARRPCPPNPLWQNGAVTSTENALEAWGNYDRDDPFPLFAQVRDLGPVHSVTLADGHAAWLVVRYDEARSLLNDPRLSKDMQAAFASGSAVLAEGLPGPAFARHMLAVDAPDHTRLRRLVSAAFSLRRIEGLRPRVQGIVDRLLDDIAAHGPNRRVDLVAEFAFPLPFTVICELLGVAEGDRETLARELTTLLAPAPTPEQYERAKAASDGVVGMLGALVEAKQRLPGDDLVTGLIRARDGDERLDQQELLSTIFQLIVAGHDTTTTLIGNGVVALLRHPDQLATLRSNPERIAAAVDEILRYDAPVPHSTFRYAVEPVDVNGVTIPAGAQVIISLASANRDPGRFDDPEVLDVDRSDQRHLAFGHGVHFCLGAALARMEGALALGSLLRRFPELRLAVSVEELRWSHGDGLVLRGLSELPVIPGPPGLRL